MVEGTVNMGVDVAYYTIKIPIVIGKKIIWKSFKISKDVARSSVRIPIRVALRLGRRLSKTSLRHLTPKKLQQHIKRVVEEYEREQLLKKNWRKNKKLEEANSKRSKGSAGTRSNSE